MRKKVLAVFVSGALLAGAIMPGVALANHHPSDASNGNAEHACDGIFTADAQVSAHASDKADDVLHHQRHAFHCSAH